MAELFGGSENKTTIRLCWDLPILAHQKDVLSRPISYFGLPGPNVLDLVDWKNVLGHRTGVERFRRGLQEREDDINCHRRILNRLAVERLSSQFCLLKGDVEDIIIKGVDVEHHHPPMSNLDANGSRRFLYDLYNLDFFGGFGYINAGGEKRIHAFQQLIERQRNHSFILLITLENRDTVTDKMKKYLDGVKEGSVHTETGNLIDWYNHLGTGRRAHLLRAVVPLFIKRVAEVNHFTCTVFPPVFYKGKFDESSAHEHQMVHFAFRLDCDHNTFHGFSKQTEFNVLSLPFLEVEGGGIRLRDLQPPTFVGKDFTSQLQCWPQAIAEIVRKVCQR